MCSFYIYGGTVQEKGAVLTVHRAVSGRQFSWPSRPFHTFQGKVSEIGPEAPLSPKRK